MAGLPGGGFPQPGAGGFMAPGTVPSYAQGLSPQHAEQLRQHWVEQMREVQQVPNDPAVFKSHQLPLARIKKIMKSDEDVRMISAEAPVLFAKACEMFILELTLRSWYHAEENKRRTLQRNDVAAAITRTDIFDFLIDIVPREDLKPEGEGGQAGGGGQAGTSSAAGAPAGPSGAMQQQQQQPGMPPAGMYGYPQYPMPGPGMNPPPGMPMDPAQMMAQYSAQAQYMQQAMAAGQGWGGMGMPGAGGMPPGAGGMAPGGQPGDTASRSAQ